MKSHNGEQVNLLGSCFPVKGMSYERMLCAVRRMLYAQKNVICTKECIKECYMHILSYVLLSFNEIQSNSITNKCLQDYHFKKLVTHSRARD